MHEGVAPHSMVVWWKIGWGNASSAYMLSSRITVVWVDSENMYSSVNPMILCSQENHRYHIRIFAKNEVGISEPLETEEPYTVQKPTGNPRY